MLILKKLFKGKLHTVGLKKKKKTKKERERKPKWEKIKSFFQRSKEKGDRKLFKTRNKVKVFRIYCDRGRDTHNIDVSIGSGIKRRKENILILEGK